MNFQSKTVSKWMHVNTKTKEGKKELEIKKSDLVPWRPQV